MNFLIWSEDLITFADIQGNGFVKDSCLFPPKTKPECLTITKTVS